MTHRNPGTRTPGTTTASREHEPALPHEQDESSRGHAGITPQQKELGRQAYGNATDGTRDTDTGPLMDQVYNDKLAPDRGRSSPRE
jgi:hypothetical protein